MIENLQGIHESVIYKNNTRVRMHYNSENTCYPLHWHIPLEIIVPIKNDYYIIHDNQKYTVKPNELVLILPGVLHSLEAPEIGERIIFLADLSLYREIKELEIVLSILPSIYIVNEETHSDIYSRILQLMKEIQNDYFSDQSFIEASIYSKLIEIFVLIGRYHTQLPNELQNSDVYITKQKEYTEKFLQICDYISEHCTEDISLDNVAAMAGFSKYHFSRLFKQFTDVSFYKYVNQKRIAYAETLLINPELQIIDIALQCGFSSPSSFIRMFKIIKSSTPTDYRKMKRI